MCTPLCVHSLLISDCPSFTLPLVKPEESLLLEHLTGLRSLQVTSLGIRDVASKFDSGYPGPSWLKPQLQSLLGATRLQHIKLKIMVKEDPIISRNDWEAIDSIFDGDAFPELMRFEINPVTVYHYRETWSVIHDKVESFFPCLQERKILDVCWAPWSQFD
jgi:hypothetical protein